MKYLGSRRTDGWNNIDKAGASRAMALTLVENFRAVFYTPFYAAFALNAYEAEGVEVQRVMSTTAAETNQALRSGRADVAWGGPIRLLLDNNQQSHSDLVIFCEVVQRDPFFLVGREPKPAWQLADLLHVRLATVSEVPTPWLCLQHDLRLAGLDPADVRRMPERSMPENLAAIRAGEIDVMQAFQPFVEQAVETGVGHIWYAAASRGLTAYTSLYTTRQCIARAPEDLLCMTRAMYRTQQWIATHSAAELAACVASFFPDLPRPTLTAALERYRTLQVWNRTPMLQPEGLAWLEAACRSGNYIQQHVPYDRCVDMRFAAQVIAEAPAACDGDPGPEPL
jgi:NitT/TauT family transport system substrate-binding protein